MDFSDMTGRHMINLMNGNDLKNLLKWAKKTANGRVPMLRSRAIRLLTDEPAIPGLLRKIRSIHLDNYGGIPTAEPVSLRASSSTSIVKRRKTKPERRASYSPEPEVLNEPPESYPLHPGVKFKPLPFYNTIAELIQPSTIMYQRRSYLLESTFVFHLTPQQAAMIRNGSNYHGEHAVQVLVRLGLLETTSEQEDHFPPGLNIWVNRQACPVPSPSNAKTGVDDMKRLSQPVDITSQVKVDPLIANTVAVMANPHYQRFVLGIYLVKKEAPDALLRGLQSKGLRVAFYTKGLIQERLKVDGEIETTCLRVSLMCPLGQSRISIPCRATTCNHVQCFDAWTFLQMNDKKPSWNCPVCHKPAPYDKLAIDGYFVDVLASKNSSNCNEIQLHADGSWSRSDAVLEKKTELTGIKVVGDDGIVISDEECEFLGCKEEPKRVHSAHPTEPIEIDLLSSTSSDESEAPVPLKKRKYARTFERSSSSSPSIIELDSEPEDLSVADKEPEKVSAEPSTSAASEFPSTVNISEISSALLTASLPAYAGTSNFDDDEPLNLIQGSEVRQCLEMLEEGSTAPDMRRNPQCASPGSSVSSFDIPRRCTKWVLSDSDSNRDTSPKLDETEEPFSAGATQDDNVPSSNDKSYFGKVRRRIKTPSQSSDSDSAESKKFKRDLPSILRRLTRPVTDSQAPYPSSSYLDSEAPLSPDSSELRDVSSSALDIPHPKDDEAIVLTLAGPDNTVTVVTLSGRDTSGNLMTDPVDTTSDSFSQDVPDTEIDPSRTFT